MFSHVMVGASDLEKSKLFYDAVLGTLGLAPGVANKQRYFYRSAGGNFAITKPINTRQPATAMATRLALTSIRPRRLMPSMLLASPTAAPAAKMLPAGAKPRSASCTWPICATPTVTKSAPCFAPPLK